MKKYQRVRRENVLERLEKQLESQTKNVYNPETKKTTEEKLNAGDVQRIKKEISTLEERI